VRYTNLIITPILTIVDLLCRPLPKSTTTALYLTPLLPPALSEIATSPCLTPLMTPAKGAGTLVAPAPGTGAMMLELEPSALYPNPPPPPSTRLRYLPPSYLNPPLPHIRLRC